MERSEQLLAECDGSDAVFAWVGLLKISTTRRGRGDKPVSADGESAL